MDVRTPTELLTEIKRVTGDGEIALAKRLGISQPTVNRILRGQENCSSKALLAIQRVHADVATHTRDRQSLDASDDAQPPTGGKTDSKDRPK